MTPLTEHESEIARLVDERASQGNLTASVVAEITASIRFVMSNPEVQFLVQYIRWRKQQIGPP